jgi:hypothetical protein
MTAPIDAVGFFDALAAAMAADPERYERLGDVELDLALVMRRPDGTDFAVRLTFHGITCDGVAEIDADMAHLGDCWLDGALSDWQQMFDNIAQHGHAVEQWTLNTLTLFGNRISLQSSDPMGEDRFHRFNQTLQEFVDASARLTVDA